LCCDWKIMAEEIISDEKSKLLELQQRKYVDNNTPGTKEESSNNSDHTARNQAAAGWIENNIKVYETIAGDSAVSGNLVSTTSYGDILIPNSESNPKVNSS